MEKIMKQKIFTYMRVGWIALILFMFPMLARGEVDSFLVLYNSLTAAASKMDSSCQQLQRDLSDAEARNLPIAQTIRAEIPKCRNARTIINKAKEDAKALHEDGASATDLAQILSPTRNQAEAASACQNVTNVGGNSEIIILQNLWTSKAALDKINFQLTPPKEPQQMASSALSTAQGQSVDTLKDLQKAQGICDQLKQQLAEDTKKSAGNTDWAKMAQMAAGAAGQLGSLLSSSSPKGDDTSTPSDLGSLSPIDTNIPGFNRGGSDGSSALAAADPTKITLPNEQSNLVGAFTPNSEPNKVGIGEASISPGATIAGIGAAPAGLSPLAPLALGSNGSGSNPGGFGGSGSSGGAFSGASRSPNSTDGSTATAAAADVAAAEAATGVEHEGGGKGGTSLLGMGSNPSDSGFGDFMAGLKNPLDQNKEDAAGPNTLNIMPPPVDARLLASAKSIDASNVNKETLFYQVRNKIWISVERGNLR